MRFIRFVSALRPGLRFIRFVRFIKFINTSKTPASEGGGDGVRI